MSIENTENGCIDRTLIDAINDSISTAEKPELISDVEQLSAYLDLLGGLTKEIQGGREEHDKYEDELTKLGNEINSLRRDISWAGNSEAIVKAERQKFADEVLIPTLNELDQILDHYEASLLNDESLKAHVEGIRILERAYSNNLVSSGLITKDEVPEGTAPELEAEATASQETEESPEKSA